MLLSLEIQNANQEIISKVQGENEINLVYKSEYQEGDRIVFKCSEKDVHLWIQFEDAKGKSLIYLKDYEIIYPIPTLQKRSHFSPKAFYGKIHLLSARIAKEYEVNTYRNLSLNVYDQDTNNITCYPHASANVETRGEVVFAARNVIDGVTANYSHGEWPFQSWGINQQDDALIKIDFGRRVKIDRIILYTRADFPHDNWWERGTFSFSDGRHMEVCMNKSNLPHEFKFEWKEVEWLEFGSLIKSPDESPFPALTQLEVYGNEIKSE